VPLGGAAKHSQGHPVYGVEGMPGRAAAHLPGIRPVRPSWPAVRRAGRPALTAPGGAPHVPEWSGRPTCPRTRLGQGVRQAGRAHRAGRTDSPGGSGRQIGSVVHPLVGVVALACGPRDPRPGPLIRAVSPDPSQPVELPCHGRVAVRTRHQRPRSARCTGGSAMWTPCWSTKACAYCRRSSGVGAPGSVARNGSPSSSRTARTHPPRAPRLMPGGGVAASTGETARVRRAPGGRAKPR